MLRCLDRLPLFVLASALLLPGTAAAQFGFDLGGFGDDGGFGDSDPVSLTATVSPADGPHRATLTLTAKIKPDWHIYSLTQPEGGPERTIITVSPSTGYTLGGEFTASPAYHSYIDQEVWQGLEIQEHGDSVTWSVPLLLAKGVATNGVRVEGKVKMQACETGGVCMPLNFDFVVNPDAPAMAPAPQTADEPTAKTVPANPGQAASSITPLIGAYDLTKIQLGAEKPFSYYIFWAFVGGLVLNLMPCVLPVIGLKVMSFVEQAGKNRVQAFALNLWYSLGILAVFLVLATMAVTIGYRWNDQGSSPVFNVGMVVLVMAMALSLLGVWEIPIPGFLGSGRTQMAAQKEGVVGAWLKGVITTLLAIPCTGPGMAIALGWAIGKDSLSIFSVFSAIGIGMASPYLVIGAFPGLVGFLPKPGAWMETFKQLMGFVLLGTVVYLLSLMDPAYLIPTLAMMTAVGLACWVYAGTPITASSSDKWQSYALCGAILLGGGVMSFGWLKPSVVEPQLNARYASATQQEFQRLLKEKPDAASLQELLASNALVESDKEWGPFSLQRLQKLVVERGETVVVDFGAAWCPTCHVLEATVLHSEAVEKAIRDTGAVTLFADYTDYPAEIKATLDSLRCQAVPVVAVFSGDDPYRPIVFSGGYTQSDIIGAINQAAGRPVEQVASKN